MAVVAVNLSQKTFSEIMSLVSRGVYSGPDQFLEVAAFNQLALERGVPVEEVAKSQLDRTQQTAKSPRNEAARAIQIQQKRIPQQRRANAPTAEELQATLARFSIEQARNLTQVPGLPEASNGQRIWGQVNRLFPLKLVIRWVAAVAQQQGDWPRLSGIAEQLASDAAVIGSSLEQADSEASRKREEMLSTGLPRTGNLQSRDRYLTQFIARVTRSGHIYPGAIAHYGFARFDDEQLMLTERGVTLAKLNNPVLDAPPFSATTTLSEDERSFLLAHINDKVGIERIDFTTILRAVEHGHHSPESLLVATRDSFPAEWSELAFRTHAYGVLARMGELGLIGKDWQGRRVQYRLTSAAETFLGAEKQSG